MPLDEEEVMTDLPKAVALFFAVKQAVGSLPKGKPTTIESYIRAFGAVEDSPLVLAAQLFDSLIAQSKT